MTRAEGELIERGRTQLLAVLGAMFVLILGPMLAAWLRGDLGRFLPQLVTLIVTFWLFRQMFLGANWARSVTVALTFVGGIVAAALGMLFSGASLAGYLVFAVGLAFIGCGLFIITSQPIEAYLQSRRGSSRRGRA